MSGASPRYCLFDWFATRPGIDVMAGQAASEFRIWRPQTIFRQRPIIGREPTVHPLNSYRRRCDNPDADVAAEGVAGALRVTAVGVRSGHLDAYHTPEAKSHGGKNCCHLWCHGEFKSKCVSWFLGKVGIPSERRRTNSAHLQRRGDRSSPGALVLCAVRTRQLVSKYRLWQVAQPSALDPVDRVKAASGWWLIAAQAGARARASVRRGAPAPLSGRPCGMRSPGW